ncbi:TPA: hypothetical protein HA239_03985 [Candidatus Woesearchaeota archaeon]|nr:hypothetical protein QT06_C0001G0785 [archaeon GW2011_AR15]MBS3103435.1 hypothetical protein [Candidatus Woesearchaeota archaeon]HIH41552.1 hypothetical protein [Candidatus Woesearchaeota archaeon]
MNILDPDQDLANRVRLIAEKHGTHVQKLSSSHVGDTEFSDNEFGKEYSDGTYLFRDIELVSISNNPIDHEHSSSVEKYVEVRYKGSLLFYGRAIVKPSSDFPRQLVYDEPKHYEIVVMNRMNGWQKRVMELSDRLH